MPNNHNRIQILIIKLKLFDMFILFEFTYANIKKNLFLELKF